MPTFAINKQSNLLIEMGKYTKIKTIDISKLTNTEYYSFLKDMLDLAPKKDEGEEDLPEVQMVLKIKQAIDLENIGVPEADLMALEEDLLALEGVLKISLVADETAMIAEHEQNRDALVLYTTSLIQRSKMIPNPTKQEAGKVLTPIIKPYIGIVRKTAKQETAMIIAMLRDLRQEKYAAYIEALQLGPILDDLEKENDAYTQMTQDRIRHRSAIKEKESATELRKRLDDEYDDFTFMLQSFNGISPTTQSREYISNLNELITQTIASYKQRSKGEDKKDEEPTEETDRPVTEDTDKGSETEGENKETIV